MQLVYQNFYKQYGIRRSQQLILPRIYPDSVFHFPRNTIYHYVSHDADNIGPDEKLTYFQEIPRRIPLDHFTTLEVVKGAARKNSLLPVSLLRPFHAKNKHFRFMQAALQAIKDPLTPIIINYGLLQKLYKYPSTPMQGYNTWWNIEKTAWKNIQKTANESDRQNFMFVHVPDILPGIASLRMFSNRVNPGLMRVFDTPDKLFILEFWKWLDEAERPTSLLADFTKEQLNKVNLVFQSKGFWTVLNLGFLEMSRKGAEVDSTFAGTQFEPVQLQKFFLRMLMQVQARGMVAEPTPETVVPLVEPPPEEENDEVTNFTTGIVKAATAAPVEPAQVEEPEEKADVYDTIMQSLDDDLDSLDMIQKKALLDKGLTNSGDDVVMSGAKQPVASVQSVLAEIHHEPTPVEALQALINEQAEYGLMPANEYRKLLTQAAVFSKSKNPYGGTETVNEFITVAPETLAIQESEKELVVNAPGIDPSMAKTTLNTFDSKYVQQVMPKDIVGMVNEIQKSGFIIQEYDIQKEESILGDYEIHTVKMKPIDGAASTVRFKLPVVNEDGTFSCNGKKYQMRKQRIERPLRKTNAVTVVLTSYYGRTFVNRSQKKAYDSIDWLAKQILLQGNDETNTHITQIGPANVFDNKFKSPRIYSGLSKYYKSFKLGGHYFTFDHRERLTLVDEADVAILEAGGRVIVGMTNDHYPMVVDQNNQFFASLEDSEQPLGDIYQLALIDQTKAPLDFAELAVFSKSIPVGIVLGYMLGFSKLLALLGVTPREFEPRQRIDLKSDEWVMAFKDKLLVFSRQDAYASLILAGFNEYKRELRQYFYESFDHPNVYMNLLEPAGIGSRFFREMDLMNQLFIDPITRDILIEMKEPVTFKGLLLRSVELLVTDAHPDAQDMREMRIRGYERFSGAVYREMVQSIRSYKARNIRGKSQLDVNPYAVWQSILQDPSVKPPAEINPIQNLKETESVTYVGEGGRNKDTMSRDTRAYHPSDMGVISEATVDSSDVGINTFLSANPKFTTLRGLTDPNYDPKTEGVTSLMSTSALSAVGASGDDPKRVGFISIQNAHSVACEGYHQPYVRTGYEQVIAHRTSDLFAYTAKEDGKVVEKSTKHILIEYASGVRKSVELGRRYGRAEGAIYPHDITSAMSAGLEFKKGDVVAYNTGFFEPDFMNPKNIVWKTSMVVKTALYESSQTLDDSSSISKRVSVSLQAKTTKERSFVVEFKQGVRNLVKPGQVLGPMDILFVIEDAVTNEAGMFDEETLKTLQMLSNKAPKAKVNCILDRIEVYYHGVKEDMSDSLKSLVTQTDKEVASRSKAAGRRITSGRVNSDYRVAGAPLMLNTAEIKLFLTVNNHAGVGDKGIFANQMKSVFGEVMDYSMTTESGDTIDAVFGYRSIANRIVTSPEIIGTTTTLLKVIAKQAVALYRQ